MKRGDIEYRLMKREGCLDDDWLYRIQQRRRRTLCWGVWIGSGARPSQGADSWDHTAWIAKVCELRKQEMERRNPPPPPVFTEVKVECGG